MTVTFINKDTAAEYYSLFGLIYAQIIFNRFLLINCLATFAGGDEAAMGLPRVP